MGTFTEHLCWVLGLEGQDVALVPRFLLQPSCGPLHPLLLQPWPRAGAAMLLLENQGDAGGGLGEAGGDSVVPAAAGLSGTRPLRRGRQKGPLCGYTCGTSTTWPR